MAGRKRKRIPEPPVWYMTRWWPGENERKDASIQIKYDGKPVYEVWFANVSEQELRAHGPVVLDLYLVTEHQSKENQP